MSDHSEKQNDALQAPDEHPMSGVLFSWTRTSIVFRMLAITLMIVGVGLVGVEIVITPHRIKDVTAIPGFHALFGFVALGLVALSGWPLGKLMRRPEDYYERRSGEAGRDR